MENSPKEDLLQFIWNHKLLFKEKLFTTDGEPLEVLHPGSLNTQQGPDFFAARIRIGQTLWVGNIEIHVLSGDWFKHKHESDLAYQNVILHVVYQNNYQVTDASALPIPTLELKPFLPTQLLENYQHLFSNKKPIPCAGLFKPIDSQLESLFHERLIIERLQLKWEKIQEAFAARHEHLEQIAYSLFLEHCGLTANKEPMLKLARTLPLALLKKLSKTPDETSALIIYTAGLHKDLTATEKTRASQLLNNVKIIPLQSFEWRTKGLRPVSFPTQKLKEAARLIAHEKSLSNYFLNLLNQPTDKSHSWGKAFSLSLCINVAAPLLFFTEQSKGNLLAVELVLEKLAALPPESNSQIKVFELLGIKPKNSLQSQALLQLKRYYCDTKQCLRCTYVVPILQTKL